jgi:hypothetical protein
LQGEGHLVMADSTGRRLFRRRLPPFARRQKNPAPRVV